MTDGSIRASDKDREDVVTVLRDAYSEGRLTLDEFDERTSAAYAAKTWGDLRELTADLPAQPHFGGRLAAGQLGSGQLGSGQPGAMQPGAMQPGVGRQPLGPDGLPSISQVTPDMLHTRQRRQRPLGRLLPVVFIWAVIAAAANSPSAAAALGAVFLCLLAVRIASSGRW
jgi:hypothetical protein